MADMPFEGALIEEGGAEHGNHNPQSPDNMRSLGQEAMNGGWSFSFTEVCMCRTLAYKQEFSLISIKPSLP